MRISQFSQAVYGLQLLWRKQRGWCLVGLVLIGDGLVITPIVYAQGSLSVTESAALGLLGLVTVALAFYLLLVMIKPEWF